MRVTSTPNASRAMSPISLFFLEFINRHSSGACRASLRHRLPEIQIEDRLLIFLDNNQDADVPASHRSSYDSVGADWQRNELGNFIVRGTMVFDAFKELSVDRVNDVRGVWEVARVAVPDFVASGIDLEITLPGVIVPIPWSYGFGEQRVLISRLRGR
jgi:hypothetical protein